jgi:hypothetical protein
MLGVVSGDGSSKGRLIAGLPLEDIVRMWEAPLYPNFTDCPDVRPKYPEIYDCDSDGQCWL